MIQTTDRAGRRERQFNWGMISKVVEKVIPEVAKSGSDLLNNPGPAGEVISEIVKAVPELAENSAGAATEIVQEVAKVVPEHAGNAVAVAGEIVKTGTALAKNPGVVVDIVKTGVEVVKKGVEILPDPSDFKGLAELVEAASSGEVHVAIATHITLTCSP